MQPIDSNTIELFEALNHQVLRITGIDRNGKIIQITEADVMSGGFQIDRCIFTGSKLEVGTAIASEMTLKLNNFSGKFNNTVFEGSELFVEIGIADWSLAEPAVTWLPCGYFTATVQPRTQTIITITALDRMMRFDQYIPAETATLIDAGKRDIVDESGNLIQVGKPLALPCTIAELVGQICEQCQVPLAQSISSITNADVQIDALPVLDQAYTFRTVLQWCVGLMGRNAYINHEGNMVIDWPSNRAGAVYISSITNRYKGVVYENSIEITGVKYKDSNGGVGDKIYWGNELGCVLDFTGNKLLSNETAADVSKATTILMLIYVEIGGFTYIPFTATVNPAPYLWPMDKMSYVDSALKLTATMLTNVHFTINGCTELQAVGETEQSALYSAL